MALATVSNLGILLLEQLVPTFFCIVLEVLRNRFFRWCWDHLWGFHISPLQASQPRQPETGSGQCSKILVVSLQNSRHSGNACWGIIRECWRKTEKKRREYFICTQYWYFKIWDCQCGLKHSLFLNPCESQAGCLWASDAVWIRGFLTCHKAICTAGCSESAGAGRFWTQAFEESPHRVALEPGTWECGLAGTCASAEQPWRRPKFGLATIPSDRMEKTGKHTSARKLRIWEPAPPKPLPLSAWADVARSGEAAGAQQGEPASAEAPGDSAGGPQAPCRAAGHHFGVIYQRTGALRSRSLHLRSF